ncbi:MAG: hypothetical protein NVSMB31_07340 [Vulcanimicrobiaceae bacterium]
MRQIDSQASIAAAVGMLIAWVASHNRSTSYNNYVRLADAWLHGRAWIEWPGEWLEAALYHGHRYTIPAPLPALFALPFVPYLHLHVNQTYIAIAVCGGILASAYCLLARLGVDLRGRILLTLFLFAGTDLWWCAELGDVWFLAQLSAMLFTFLTLNEVLGRKRALLIGIYVICAFESRAILLLAVPLYLWLMCKPTLYEPWSMDRRRLGIFACTMAVGAGIYMAYNYWQWQVPYDIGFGLYFRQDSWGQSSGIPFSLAYIPYQLYSYFIQGPQFIDSRQLPLWPFFKVDPKGVALTFTSPALLLAFFAREPQRFVVALWATVGAICCLEFTYYLNGWYQFGMRHALDFMPFLIVLMALAIKDRSPGWWYGLLAWSVSVGVWGVWYWNVFFRTGD